MIVTARIELPAAEFDGEPMPEPIPEPPRVAGPPPVDLDA